MSHESLVTSRERLAVAKAQELSSAGSNSDRTNMGDYTYALMKTADLSPDEAIRIAEKSFGSIESSRKLSSRILQGGGIFTGVADGLAYVEAEEKTRELSEQFEYPQYRTLDAEDVEVKVLEDTVDLLYDLKEVDVTDELKMQAVFIVGQFLIDGLAEHETQQIAADLSEVLSVVDKPYFVMVRVPEGVARG